MTKEVTERKIKDSLYEFLLEECRRLIFQWKWLNETCLYFHSAYKLKWIHWGSPIMLYLSLLFCLCLLYFFILNLYFFQANYFCSFTCCTVCYSGTVLPYSKILHSREAFACKGSRQTKILWKSPNSHYLFPLFPSPAFIRTARIYLALSGHR